MGGLLLALQPTFASPGKHDESMEDDGFDFGRGTVVTHQQRRPGTAHLGQNTPEPTASFLDKSGSSLHEFDGLSSATKLKPANRGRDVINS